jgi:hypothetical protein
MKRSIRVSSSCQVQLGARREKRPTGERKIGSGSRFEPSDAARRLSRNEGVPGSSPGVGFELGPSILRFGARAILAANGVGGLRSAEPKRL